MTAQVLVVHVTTLGNTGRLADAVADGARSVPDTKVVAKHAPDADQDDARAADAVILGSPVRHRTADSRIKDFIERVLEQLWLTDEMVGKVGATFSVGGGYGSAGAGAELAQLGMLGAFAASGMILVPLPKTTPGSAEAGLHWGPSGRSGAPADMAPTPLTEGMLTAGFHHGANVARVTHALLAGAAGHPLFAGGNQAPPPVILAQFQG